ncbi:MAG TPA: hypothetical protein VM689_08210 [Aliidongia sp.]|nr:hypothetical protein [Aliidongia sp.]
MTESLAREFLTFEVAETSLGRGYWLDRPWVDEAQRPALVQASILALPHERGSGPVFPDGSEEFLARLRQILGSQASLGVAIRSDDYEELALHSRAWRLPVLFVTYAALPVMLNILSARLDELLPGHKTGDTAEITLFVEGANHKTLKLHYKGDPKDLGDFFSRSIPRYIGELDTAPAARHQVDLRARARQTHRNAPVGNSGN